MKWKCLIVDDEPPAIKVIEKYIELVDGLELAGSCVNAFDAINFLQSEQIDLIFLDIQMPKLSGIMFLNTLKTRPRIIFTTAYKEFALDAFDLDAVDYLLKPISLERFLKAINKLTPANIPAVEGAKDSDKNDGFLYFRAQRKMVKLFLEEIIYIESIKDYIRIHRTDDKPLVVKQSISTVEAMLPETLFVRVHRSFIVSINKITAYTSHDIELGNVEIPVGRFYQDRFDKLRNG